MMCDRSVCLCSQREVNCVFIPKGGYTVFPRDGETEKQSVELCQK